MQQAQQAAIQTYHAAINDQSQLYNGSEYFNYTRFYQLVEGNQFHPGAAAQPGTLTYWGHRYAGIPLLYDIHLDQVVVRQPNSLFDVALLSTEVSAFTIGNRSFVRLAGPVADQGAGPGFYEVMLAGADLRLLAKRYKDMLDQPAQNMTRVVFSSADRYFLQLGDDQLLKIKGKQSVLAAFPRHRKLLLRHIRDKRLFTDQQAREADIVQLVLYRTSLPDRP
ncbi:hypothetical protein CDA63_03100 [Hymenobacter amundsenii]|uniref:Uncharacterized protein n=1 Tax=Hymenobacter amundsenii TaxID=2006685 RepID=A0A246FPT3_9BACT|nr:hypothetical protein CDA63_03100 [Hymenobacter amundsenii]